MIIKLSPVAGALHDQETHLVAGGGWDASAIGAVAMVVRGWGRALLGLGHWRRRLAGALHDEVAHDLEGAACRNVGQPGNLGARRV